MLWKIAKFGLLPIVLVLFVLACSESRVEWIYNRFFSRPPQSAVDAYFPLDWKPSERELSLVFIGSPHCAASMSKSLPRLIERAKTDLSARASTLGVEFSTSGVAVATNANVGLQFLTRFGAFDEIASGRSWENAAYQFYIKSGSRSVLATPQLVVLERRNTGNSGRMSNIHVLLTITGAAAISQWVIAGSPLAAPY